MEKPLVFFNALSSFPVEVSIIMPVPLETSIIMPALLANVAWILFLLAIYC